MLGVGMLGLGGSVFMFLNAMGDNLMFYLTPTQVRHFASSIHPGTNLESSTSVPPCNTGPGARPAARADKAVPAGRDRPRGLARDAATLDDPELYHHRP